MTLTLSLRYAAPDCLLSSHQHRPLQTAASSDNNSGQRTSYCVLRVIDVLARQERMEALQRVEKTLDLVLDNLASVVRYIGEVAETERYSLRIRCDAASMPHAIEARLVAPIIDVAIIDEGSAILCLLLVLVLRCSSPSFLVASIFLFMTSVASNFSSCESLTKRRRFDYFIAVSINLCVQNAAGNRGRYLLLVCMRASAGSDSNGPRLPHQSTAAFNERPLIDGSALLLGGLVQL
ncbi:uncharacterized protein BT62DRAFT_1006232 [Guyanagaster necrorhizus]|uniref:Uncharacterized protein n=1 Tax=Guyanagaster necrorhizus TaxID=856835 RepID=A0A9P7VTB4_9AGAR|nr:uncharacterized protein BT62DRAFT_1006232 [Guyanagaster necrorhizus MCA 3950]KAG7446055.1 hypothetical protein BT62DRAFT_1006232 [Guyanagaster necrorhizus MCA 3950]